MHILRLEEDHQTLTFGVMQLFGTMQPGGPTTTSMTTNFSPQQLEKFCVKISKFLFCFHCEARPLIRVLGTKNTYVSFFVSETWPLKVSKHLWAPQVDSLEPLGPGCCVVGAMWCGVLQWGGVGWGVTREGYAFFTIKKMHVYLIDS